MAFRKLWTIAYRDLGRNRRRTFFTMFAVAIGLGLTIVLSGLIAGAYDDGIQNSIRLETGHVQLRAESYDPQKLSLQWKDLLKDPEALVAKAKAMDEVAAAAPVLWATGVLNTLDEAAGLKFYGIDPTSPVHDPIRESMVAGEFLTADDRSGFVIGKRLADDLGVQVGQKVTLAVVNADGEPEEATFTVRGLFATGFPAYDQGALFMPLAKAQAFTRTDGHASAVVIMLHRQEDADKVAAALQEPGVAALTWRDLNEVVLELMKTATGIYNLLYAIVLVVVVVVVANTLLMAVFERVQEVGILSALGMRRRQIMIMFLLEAAIIALVGIVLGFALGAAGVAYLARVGIYIGDASSSMQGFTLGTRMYGSFDPQVAISLSLWTLALTLVASLYPAWFASRMEPVKALHTVQ
jgi:ABC-type lipoprotein release transport system permease subunit